MSLSTSSTLEDYEEKGLLSPSPSTSSSPYHKDSTSSTPIIIRTTHPRHSYISSLAYTLLGILLSFLILTISSTSSLRALDASPAVHLDLGLEPALQHPAEPEENGYWCGTTPAQARARGCKFDVILYSWVPPLCHDADLQAAYLEQRESEWYLERGGGDGKRVSQERAAMGEEKGLWLPWRYHAYHCEFIFKMMTRIMRNSSMGIPGRLLEYYHTDHCINVLTGREHTPPVDISTLVSLNYSTCYSRA